MTDSMEITSQWQPIETAPTNGERVLLYNAKTGGVFAAKWTIPGHGDFWCWCVDDFKFGPFPVRGYNLEDLTHWMPLPPGPKE